MNKMPERWWLQSDDFSSGSTIRLVGTLSSDGVFSCSGPLPKIRADATVDIRIDASLLDDPGERDSWLRVEGRILFWQGETLRVRVRPRDVPAGLAGAAIREPNARDLAAAYVEVRLDEPLVLLSRRSGLGKLKDVRCFIPSLERRAKSLNEACRMVSEAFEPHRRSHAANVFQEVFYEDLGWWIALGAYRSWVESGNPTLRAEQPILPTDAGQTSPSS